MTYTPILTATATANGNLKLTAHQPENPGFVYFHQP